MQGHHQKGTRAPRRTQGLGLIRTLALEVAMRARKLNTEARRSVFVPLCAVAGLGLCLLFAQASCLNPVPDEYPSNQGNPAAVVDEPTTAAAPQASGAPSFNAEAETPRPSDPGAATSGDLSLPAEPAADAGAPSADAGTDGGARDTDAVQ
jgi:hypothetical protein